MVLTLLLALRMVHHLVPRPTASIHNLHQLLSPQDTLSTQLFIHPRHIRTRRMATLCRKLRVSSRLTPMHHTILPRERTRPITPTLTHHLLGTRHRLRLTPLHLLKTKATSLCLVLIPWRAHPYLPILEYLHSLHLQRAKIYLRTRR